MFDHVDAALAHLEFYEDFRADRLSAAGFAAAVLGSRDELIGRGVAPDDVHFATRFPPDPAARAEAIAQRLRRRGVLDGVVTDRAGDADFAADVAATFDHGPYCTYIYPEEALLLRLIVRSSRPQRAAFLGSYYGYWACWALDELAAGGGHAELIDLDPAVSALATANIKRRGLESVASVGTADAIEVVAAGGRRFDLIVIDAETAADHPDPERRGKAIYHPMLAAALGAALPGAIVLFHNVVLSHFNADPFFAQLIERYRREYARLLPLAGQQLVGFAAHDTTEGIAAGRVRR